MPPGCGAETRLQAGAGFYSALAPLMSMTWLYGTFSYLVTRRRREIAVRVPVGVRAFDIVRLVMGRIAPVLAMDAVVGLVVSAAAS